MNEPLRVNVDELTVMNDIRIRLAQVTQEDVASTERRLSAHHPADKDIGTVVSAETRALYVLKTRLSSESDLEEAHAKMATDELMEQQHLQKAALLDMLEDVVSEMWWTQAKLDTGFLEKQSVGIRHEWMLVRGDERGHGGILEAIIAHGMPRLL